MSEKFWSGKPNVLSIFFHTTWPQRRTVYKKVYSKSTYMYIWRNIRFNYITNYLVSKTKYIATTYLTLHCVIVTTLLGS